MVIVKMKLISAAQIGAGCTTPSPNHDGQTQPQADRSLHEIERERAVGREDIEIVFGEADILPAAVAFDRRLLIHSGNLPGRGICQLAGFGEGDS